MFKTKNGNNKLTLEEFRNELKKIHPTIDNETSQVLYKELDHWLIGRIEAMKPEWDGYHRYLKFIKEEHRDEWIVVYIHLSYDTANGWCPQDYPYCIALLDTKDGTIYSLDWIRNFIKEKSKNEKA